MAYTSPPKTWVAADVLTAAQLNTYLRDMIEALFPVGYMGMVMQAATSVETLVGGVWLECNGTAVSRSTYSDLNTLMSGISYPFGSGNGTTTFNLPDFRGRSFTNHATTGGHANVNTLGDSDALALASRNPKGSVSVSGTTGGHTHGAGSFVIATGVIGSGSTGTTPAGGTPISGTSASSTATFSGSGTVPGNYLVGGIYVIKAFT